MKFHFGAPRTNRCGVRRDLTTSQHGKYLLSPILHISRQSIKSLSAELFCVGRILRRLELRGSVNVVLSHDEIVVQIDISNKDATLLRR